jgi:hypothetical protein
MDMPNETLSAAPQAETRTNPDSRLVSLDALCGFDMLWICGLDLIFRYLGKHFDVAWLKCISIYTNPISFKAGKRVEAARRSS